MARYLLDTNHVTAALRPNSSVRQRIHESLADGNRIGTCIPVLCELEAGIQQMRDQGARRQTLRQFLRRIRLWPIDQKICEFYGAIYVALRRRGRVLSQVDMMLAALAQQLNLTLLTSDKDFEALPDVPRESWIT